MNILFCSYANASDKTDINEMLTNSEFFINFERIFAFYQMTKVLKFMDIEYRHLIEKTAYSDSLRKTFYKENTNVLSYYIITTILLNNYQDFLIWCKANNTSMLQFKKTSDAQNRFCDFIATRYKRPEFLRNIECSEKLINKLIKGSKKDTIDTYSTFLLNNLRMTLCELC